LCHLFQFDKYQDPQKIAHSNDTSDITSKRKNKPVSTTMFIAAHLPAAVVAAVHRGSLVPTSTDNISYYFMIRHIIKGIINSCDHADCYSQKDMAGHG